MHSDHAVSVEVKGRAKRGLHCWVRARLRRRLGRQPPTFEMVETVGGLVQKASPSRIMYWAKSWPAAECGNGLNGGRLQPLDMGDAAYEALFNSSR